MRKLIASAIAAVVALATVASARQPSAVEAAATALGVANVRTLQFSGSGNFFVVAQSVNPNAPWPRFNLTKYTADINYETGSMRADFVRTQFENPPRGGGNQPLVGEQRQILVVRGNTAWNVPPPAPPPAPAAAAPAPPEGRGRGQGQPEGRGRGDAQPEGRGRGEAQPPAQPEGRGRGDAQAEGRGSGDAPAEGRGRGQAQAQPPAPQPQLQPQAAADERMLQIHLTPHGFLKGAMANKAATRAVRSGTEATYSVGKYRIVGTMNARGEVERVQTWIPNDVLGDMVFEAEYSGYRDFSGVKFPARVVFKQGGYPTFDINVSAVRTNVAFDPAVLAVVRGATIPPPQVTVEKVAEGVYYLTGGSHHSVAVEMRDHVVVIEGPQNEQRAAAVIAKVKETIPGKPIRFVVNTHHHFDHSGGLRTFVDEGATVVTHRINQSFYEKAWAVPRTLSPDRLAQSRKRANFQTFGDKHVLSDGGRTIELHHIAGNGHNDGIVMAYLPRERILVEADVFTVNAPNQPAPATPNVYSVNLHDNIARLKLDVGPILGLHGRATDMAELRRMIGRTT